MAERTPISLEVAFAPEFETGEQPVFDVDNNVYIEVLPEIFTDKDGQTISSILLSKIHDIAEARTLKEFPVQRGPFLEAVKSISEARGGKVCILGPDKGSYLMEIPKHAGLAA